MQGTIFNHNYVPMHTAILKRTLIQLDSCLKDVQQVQNALCKNSCKYLCKYSCPVTRCVIALVADTPCVTYTNFTLDSCRLEGEEGRLTFVQQRLNVLTVRTPFPLPDAGDWSACILQGMGEIVSIAPSNSGIKITYRVATAADAIGVSISYRDVSIFPAPVRIDRAVYKSTGRLAFCIVLLNLNSKSSCLWDVSPDGNAVALYNARHVNARIYEIEKKGTQSYRRSSLLTKINTCQEWRITSTRTIIGTSLNGCQLLEVSFEDVIVQTFPFKNVCTFDFCEASDSMVLSFYDSTDIIVASLSTGKTLKTIPRDISSCTVYISPSGQFIFVSQFPSQIFSSRTGELIKEMKFNEEDHMVQFLSDETIMVINNTSYTTFIMNIITGEKCEFLPNFHFEHFLVRGLYAYNFVNGKLCAYE